jgi:pimeloyl-ACP methyl ester carboxylesterase
MLSRMSTFGLVHGAWHGAWVWERLVPELEVRGHHHVAVDLPCEDDDAGLDEYARTVADALGDAEDVVLVGHSLGGLTVPRVAALRPVARIVLVAALLPREGMSLVDQLRADRGILIGGNEGRRIDERRRLEWFDAAAAIRALYGDVDTQVAAAAFARLRPQANKPHVEKATEPWPDVPTTHLVCAQDRMVSPDYQRRAPFPQQLVASAHAPMLSRPTELARLLCA